LTRAHLLDDTVDIAVPAGHRLAGRTGIPGEAGISLAEFGDDDWISWNEGQFCHEWLVFTLRGTGIEPRIAHIAEEHHTQLAFVEAGLGVCVAPKLGRGPVPQRVRLLPVCDSVRRHVYAVWRADADRRPSIQAAVHSLRQVAAGLR
ncbi:LysR substrate-binding domain-containing protein, partial [Streptomyces sp. NPDC054840]